MTTPDPEQDTATASFEPPAAPPTAAATAPQFAAPEPDAIPAPVPVAPVSAGSAQPPTGPAGGSRGSARVLNVVLGVAVLVAVAGIAFAVGRSTAPSGSSAVATVTDPGGVTDPGTGNGPLGGQGPDASFDLNGNGNGNGNGRPDDDGDGFGRGGPFGGFGASVGIQGTVQSVDADSVTITLPDGTTVTFGIDGSTTYHQQAGASAADVTVGSTVIVNPAGGFRPGRGSANGSDGLTLGSAGSITVLP